MRGSKTEYVDLDGTLAYWDGYSIDKVGKPILPMLRRVRNWLHKGIPVKIFTARVGSHVPPEENRYQIQLIRHWCVLHVGQELPVTNEKGWDVNRIWDDRAVHVERNTGRRVL